MATSIWTAGENVAVGDKRAATTSRTDGFIFECSAINGTATTSNSEPLWPSILGSTVIDNNVTWKAISSTFEELQKYNPSAIIELFEVHFSQILHYEKWKADTVYNVGDIVSGITYQTSGYVFECTESLNDKKSGSSEPSWPTVLTGASNTVTDDQLKWTSAEPIKRFHSGINEKTGVNYNTGSIRFNSKVYEPFPISCEGFNFSSKGQLPRPKLIVSNLLGSKQGTTDWSVTEAAGPAGTISSILLSINNVLWKAPDIRASGNDLIGSKLIRIRTLARFLDATNFTGGNNDADPYKKWPDEIYFLARKSTENREVIEWECRSSFDMAGIKSGRQILPDEFPGIGEFMI